MQIEAIEAPVTRLVEVLNRYPAIHTFTSCAGHPNPGPEQCNEGDFYVGFVVERTTAGWRSLERIVFAATGELDVRVSAWCAGDASECLAFEVRGTNRLDPEAVADALVTELNRLAKPSKAPAVATSRA